MSDDRMQRRFAALDEAPIRPDPGFVVQLRRTVHSEAIGEAGSPADTIDEPEGETTMITLTKHEPRSEQRPRKRAPLALAGAAAAVVIIVVGLWAAMNDADNEPVETADGRGSTDAPASVIPVDGVENDEAEAEAFAVVDAAYGAHAAGDAEAWFNARSPGSFFRTEEVRQEEIEAVAASMAAGERFEVTGCSSHGFGDWPGLTDSGDSAAGYRFTCEATSTDLLHNRGGIKQAATFEWVVADGDVVAVTSEELTGESRQFDHSFNSWLEQTHPDVYSDLTFLPVSGGFTADSTTIALQYVGEFVEQSDLYPLDAANP